MTEQNLPKVDDDAIKKAADKANVDGAALQKVVGTASFQASGAPTIVQTIKSLQQKLSSQPPETANKPYVLELSAYILLEHSEGRPVESLVAAANKNGVSTAQLVESIEYLKSLSDQSEEALKKSIRETYIADGRKHGYIGTDATPTTWVAGQLARAYYSE